MIERRMLGRVKIMLCRQRNKYCYHRTNTGFCCKDRHGKCFDNIEIYLDRIYYLAKKRVKEE